MRAFRIIGRNTSSKAVTFRDRNGLAYGRGMVYILCIGRHNAVRTNPKRKYQMTTENKTIKVEVPATVAARVCGVDQSIDIASFADESIAYAFTYGVRRLFQDNGNSIAKAKRDAGENVDPEAIFAARMAQMEAGEFAARGNGSGETFTDEELALYDIAIEAKGKPGWQELATAYAACKGMTTDERRRAVLDAVLSLDKKRRDKLASIAKARLESLASLDI